MARCQQADPNHLTEWRGGPSRELQLTVDLAKLAHQTTSLKSKLSWFYCHPDFNELLFSLKYFIKKVSDGFSGY